MREQLGALSRGGPSSEGEGTCTQGSHRRGRRGNFSYRERSSDVDAVVSYIS